jgi:membrane protein YqaA with SNARE-associated domain
MMWLAAAALWGFAEATVFFLVPDMVLTYAVLRLGLRKALVLGLCSAFAATLGGLVMWRWGHAAPVPAQAFLLHIPGIAPDLLTRVQGDMTAGDWPLLLARGAITGTPYKIYAVQAGIAGLSPLVFALVSLPARFLRFAAAMGLTALAQAALRRVGLDRWSYALLALGWVGVYSFYGTLRWLAAHP